MCVFLVFYRHSDINARIASASPGGERERVWVVGAGMTTLSFSIIKTLLHTLLKTLQYANCLFTFSARSSDISSLV